MKHHAFIYLFILLVGIFTLVVVYVLGIMSGFQLSEKEYISSTLPTLSVLGTWVGAFATCSAVLLSLWLAFQQISKDKVVLKCLVNNVLSSPDMETKYISVNIVSTGNKPANIRSIGWFGKDAKTAIWVKDFHYTSSHLPTVLNFGEELVVMHTPELYFHLNNYVEEHLGGDYGKLICLVHTTTESIEVAPNQEVIDSVKDANKLS